VCWSSTKWTSSSSHWKLTCSRHHIAENSALNNTHSLTHSNWYQSSVRQLSPFPESKQHASDSYLPLQNQSSMCQTVISLYRIKAESDSYIPLQKQSSMCQTVISLYRIKAESDSYIPLQNQSSMCQTVISLYRIKAACVKQLYSFPESKLSCKTHNMHTTSGHLIQI
jgi:hypothetical protein